MNPIIAGEEEGGKSKRMNCHDLGEQSFLASAENGPKAISGLCR